MSKIEKIFPLAGDIVSQRLKAKKLLDTANPITVQIVLAILAESQKQRRLKADFLKGWQDAEKERNR